MFTDQPVRSTHPLTLLPPDHEARPHTHPSWRHDHPTMELAHTHTPLLTSKVRQNNLQTTKALVTDPPARPHTPRHGMTCRPLKPWLLTHQLAHTPSPRHNLPTAEVLVTDPPARPRRPSQAARPPQGGLPYAWHAKQHTNGGQFDCARSPVRTPRCTPTRDLGTCRQADESENPPTHAWFMVRHLRAQATSN